MKKLYGIILALAVVSASLMGSAAYARPGKGLPTGVVNVNDAGVAQLMMLPGIGPKKALAIRDYAAAHPFKSVEELKEVKGISDRNLEKLKPHVTVSGPTTAAVPPAKTAPAAPVSSASPR